MIASWEQVAAIKATSYVTTIVDPSPCESVLPKT
jgi:hypothetical protein